MAFLERRNAPLQAKRCDGGVETSLSRPLLLWSNSASPDPEATFPGFFGRNALS
jgi:hypothetical protein